MRSTLESIAAFVREHHVLTLATSRDDSPYATPLFYAYDDTRNCFVFASAEETEHTAQMKANPSVAAGIALETDAVGKIQGLQCRGRVVASDAADARCYYARFPYARALLPTLWRLEPSWMKLTDNRLGFGKKLVWEAAAAVE
ncbi:pyridoxamine 5'-phosphate oxidase family protein [Sulfurimonas sp. HSL-1656]|uniref:pyridoxamine 5'-phosphate oxidase family protein n=1 Tax=Thiomicrolovo subterrani TaxID=3131934 RepID=UPI0031F96EED